MTPDHWKEFKEMCSNHYWATLEKDKEKILAHIDGIIRSFEALNKPKDQPNGWA